MDLRFSRSILLFSRAPEAEARAKGLPPSSGARLFEAFLRGWTRRAAEADADLIVVTPGESVARMRRLLPGATVWRQGHGAFGDKLNDAFGLAFEHGSSTVIMVGGDGPPLSLDEIQRAFDHLSTHPRALVLAPASDGGVNAIGLNLGAEREIEGVEWQSGDVFGQLRSFAERHEFPSLVMALGHDVDTARDARNLYRLSRRDPVWRPFRLLLLRVFRAGNSSQGRPVRLPDSALLSSRWMRGPPFLSSCSA